MAAGSAADAAAVSAADTEDMRTPLQPAVAVNFAVAVDTAVEAVSFAEVVDTVVAESIGAGESFTAVAVIGAAATMGRASISASASIRRMDTDIPHRLAILPDSTINTATSSITRAAPFRTDTSERLGR